MPKQFHRDEGDERDVSLQTLRSVQKLTQRRGDAEKIDQGVCPFTLKVFFTLRPLRLRVKFSFGL